MSAPSVMRHLLAAALIAIPSAAGANPLDEQVRAAYSAWNAAFNKGDTEAVAAFYTGDASFLPVTHEVIHGPDGIKKFFSGLFAGGVTDHALDLIRTAGDDKIVIAAAKWSAAGKDAAGKATGSAASPLMCSNGSQTAPLSSSCIPSTDSAAVDFPGRCHGLDV